LRGALDGGTVRGRRLNHERDLGRLGGFPKRLSVSVGPDGLRHDGFGVGGWRLAGHLGVDVVNEALKAAPIWRQFQAGGIASGESSVRPARLPATPLSNHESKAARAGGFFIAPSEKCITAAISRENGTKIPHAFKGLGVPPLTCT
jgi:hypothetical protein